MGSFFNLENGFFTTIGKIVDMILLSIVWSIVCIPIITIGPATAALYYTTVKVIRRERGYLLKEFFRSFRMNFKLGTLSGITIMLLFLMLFFDRQFASAMESDYRFILWSIFNAIIIILFCVSIYVFPILSRFKTNYKQLMKTSLFMAMRHLPTTVMMAIIVVAFGVATYLIQILFIIAPALCTLLVSLLMERILKKYMPEKTEEAEYNGVDEWYLE